MTRIKKLLLAGSMAVVTCCVSLSSSILNVSSLFTRVKVNADTNPATNDNTQDFNNTHKETTTQNGKVITVSNIPSSTQKGGDAVYIPSTIFTSTVGIDGTITGITPETKPTIIIKNPYGVSLLDKDGNPIVHEPENGGGSTDTETDEDAPTTDGSDVGSNPVQELVKISEGDTNPDLTEEDKKHPNTFKFTPAQIGTYTVQYAVNTNPSNPTEGVWTTSNIYKIDVSAEQFSIEFVPNNPIVMPDQIDTNLKDEDKSIDIALPVFYDGHGDQIKHFVLETDNDSYYIVADYVTLENVFLDSSNSPVSVSEHPADAEGKNVYEKYSTYQIRKLSKTDFNTENVSTTEYPNGKYEFSVVINTKVSTKPAMSNSAVLTPKNVMTIESLNSNLTEGKVYNYSNYTYRFVAGNGLNFIDYRLYETNSKGSSSVTMPLSSISKSIDGSVSYNRDKINVGVSVSSNIRSSSTSIGKKTYLPAVNTVNKNANRNSMPAYYYYKIAYIDDKNDDALVYDDSSKVVMGVDEGGVYFIPKVQGKFNIYYNAQDFYYDKVSKKDGHTDAFADDYDYDVNVTDRTSPDLFLVNTYNYDNLDKTSDDEVSGLYGDELKEYLKGQDISYTIPTKYNISTDRNNLTKIKIPAIYTEDNYKTFSELRVFRTITSTNGFKYKDEVQNNFSIRVQDGSSGNATNFSTSLSGIFIDDIVTFDFGGNLPDNIYYAQGRFYDTEKAEPVSDTTIKDHNLAIDGDKVIVTKDESGTPVEDTSKRADGKYFVKDVDGVKKIYESKSFSDESLIKKWKTSALATITIDPNLFSAGEYTIEFRVTDGVYSNNTGDKFTFTLVENTSQEDLDKEAPEVKFTTATTIGNVGKDQEISLAKPRVTDDVDNRILVKYYVEANGKYKEIKLDDNNKLTFKTSDKVETSTGVEETIYDLATASTDKTLRVVTIAYDDFAGNDIPFTIEQLNDNDIETVINGNKHIGYAVYPISVKYVEDALAPVIHKKLTFAGTENNFKQGEKVLINGIEYYDNTQNAYLKSIRVVDSKGNVCASQSLTFTDFKEIIDARVEDGEKRTEVENEIRNQLISSIKKVDTTDIPGNLAVSSADKNSYIYKYYFPGISFIATEAENYTITYELCDMGTNNITALTFVTSQAEDTEAPSISGTTDATNTIELGETYYIGDIKVSDNSEGDITLSSVVKGAKTGNQDHWLSKLDNGTFVFNPQQVDVYTITLTAIDSKGNSSSKSFVVTVKDTSKPTIELNKQFPTGQYGEYAGSKITIDEKEGDPEIKDGEIIVEGGTNKDGVKIKWADNKLPSVNLPGFSARDKYQEVGYDSLGANGSITIKSPDDVNYVIDSKGNVTGGQNEIKLEMKSHLGVNYFSFTPTKRGHYVATYTATDLNGNNAEKNEVIDIYVGDTEVPVIYLTNKLNDKLNKGFVVGENDQLVINPDARIYQHANYTSQDLYVEDNYGFNTRENGKDDDKYEYVTVSISVTNENNSTIRQQDSQGDGQVRYKFDTAGTYTITFTVTDECGNTGTFHRTFVVSKDRPNILDTTKIVGIVLIVVSVLILGGVVIYFVKGTKFLPKRKKNAKGKKNKSESPAEKQD